MSKYKGLFTFDEDNHRYVPIAQADGTIDTMDYEPDSKPAELCGETPEPKEPTFIDLDERIRERGGEE